MQTAAGILIRLSRVLDAIALWGAVAAVAVMVLAASWQVVARYALAAPPIWTEELARYSMVWAGMLGASCALKAGTDPALFPEMRAVRGFPGAVLLLIRTAGVAIFAGPILYYSLFGPNADISRGYLGRMLGRSADTLPFPMAVFAIAIPVAFALIFIHLLASVASVFLERAASKSKELQQ